MDKMQHFKEAHWIQYLNNDLKEEDRNRMEAHLSNCDECLDKYLSLLEDSVMIETETPSPDFTMKVLKQIDFPKHPKRKAKPKKNMVFTYYVVAASITMILMYSGFFRMIEQQVPQVTGDVVNSTRRVERIFASGWTDRLMDSTLDVMKLIEFKQGSDRINEN